ncbi:hypothetical protein [Undibacterium sp. Ji49W]|uniref:hypothetical protein n=1 Tax=Undibacterium sp. Ji49W TaxID=3413040 RepID=UPI003BF1CD05
MHSFYFPSCKIEGDIEPPVPFNHMGRVGAVPNKCGSCNHLFEGGCTRYIDLVNKYLHLDYGPCKIDGPTDPVVYEDEFIEGKVEVPRKCSKCYFLKFDRIYGFICTHEEGKWGKYYRGLDWGAWEPESIYLQLPLPKVTTKILSKYVMQNDLIGFIKEYRKCNPSLSIAEAKKDFTYLKNILLKN